MVDIRRYSPTVETSRLVGPRVCVAHTLGAPPVRDMVDLAVLGKHMIGNFSW